MNPNTSTVSARSLYPPHEPGSPSSPMGTVYARNFVDANNPTLPLIGKSEAQIAQAGGLMNAAGALNPQPAEANIGGEYPQTPGRI